MKLLDGKALSGDIKDRLKVAVETGRENGKLDEINLAIIQVGDNDASSVYIKNKMKTCDYIGIDSTLYKLPEDTTENDVIDLIEELNYHDMTTGILVQLPLPYHIDENKVVSAINSVKDVDGLTSFNVGNLFLGDETLIPCTPYGIMSMLNYYDIEIEGKECVVVGRSNIVGKPIAMLLLWENGTVTICHSKTNNLKEVCKRADILVCAIGKPNFFNEDYVKNGAVVIDVGIHKLDNGKLTGDVDFDSVKDIVSAITPVPGGVGAMTVVSLMYNCIKSAMIQRLAKEMELIDYDSDQNWCFRDKQ